MNTSIFQTKEWEEFKLKTGYEKSYWVDGILVLQKRLPFGRTMLYSPMANKYQISNIKYQIFIDQIIKIADENNAIFFRLEIDTPILEIGNWKLEILQNFKKSFEEMQPENNWVLDIMKSEEDILAGMKQKCRYNIKVAQKNDIEITSSNTAGKELDIFYDLYTKTGKRKSVTYRSKAYFQNLLDIFGKIDYAKAYAATAKIGGKEKPLAAAIILFYGKEALYLYGGSSDENKNLMAPYLLHWEIIKDAKTKGMEKYNFLGVAPNEDEKHPWAGITRFKKGFGGEQVDIAGCYDLPLRPLEYQIFKIAEKIRR